jgi:hypothetical protein
VAGATSYDVYFGTSNPLSHEATVPTNSWTPPAMTGNTTYYWKVIPRGTVPPVEDCTPWSFTTVTTPCATTPSPTHQATGIAIDTVLRWTVVTGASSYKVYFGAFTPPPLAETVTTNSYIPPAMDEATKYYWQIIPIIDDVAATGCVIWEFTTGIIPKCAENPSPANGATCVEATPLIPGVGRVNLSWTPVAGATNYRVQYGPDASVSTVNATTPNTSYPYPTPIPIPNPNSQVYWKITPIFGVGADAVEATNCEVWSFTWACSGCPPPAQPSAISPSTPVCEGSTQTYSVGNVAGVDYTWSVPADWTITDQNSSSITVTVGTSGGIVEVVPSNSCGEGTARTLLVTVNPTYLDEDVITICANELPYEYGDSVFMSGGPKNVYFENY